MALETLEGVTNINGCDVYHCPKGESIALLHEGEEDLCLEESIAIDSSQNTMVITFQDGPIKEVGVNGVQIETLVAIYGKIVEEFNKKYPHRENEVILKHVEGIMEATERRKRDRESRGVEGRSKL